MLSKDEVEVFLKAELAEAQSKHELARREFWRLSASVSTGTDGQVQQGLALQQSIREAAASQAEALNQVVIALKRLNGFLCRGEVPDYMKAREGAAAAAARAATLA